MTKRDIAIFLFKWYASILSAFLLVVGTATAFVYLTPPSFAAKAKILVERNRPPVMRAIAAPGMDLAEALNTESEILLSRYVMEVVVDRTRPHERPRRESTMGRLMGSVRDGLQSAGLSYPIDQRESWIESLQKRVKVKPTIDAGILKVTYYDEDPEWSARIVNAVIDAYIEHHVRVFSVSGTSELFKSQSDAIEADLKKKRAELATYKRRLAVTAVEDTRRELVRQAGSLGDQISTAQSELGGVLLRYEHGHPEVRLAEVKLQRLRERLQSVRGELDRLETEKEIIDELKAEVDALEDSLRDYNKRYEEARLNEGARGSTINVSAVDRASVPVRPDHSRLFYIFMAIAAGLPLAVIAAVIREYFDRRMVAPAAIEELLAVPHLGTVGLLPGPARRAPRPGGTGAGAPRGG